MTVLHRKISIFFIFICSLRFLWIFHVPGCIKIGEKSSVWFVQSSGPMKFCQIYQSTNWLIGKFDKNIFFCQICQLTNFYLYLLSKVFMTVLHRKCDKWLCSTKFWETTVLHQNLRNDRPPLKNLNFLYSSAL